MKANVKKSGNIGARTTESLREAPINKGLIVSVSVLIIIAVICSILFYTRNIPVINRLTDQKVDANALQDKIGNESKSIKGAASTQGYEDTASKSASSYTGSGTGGVGGATAISGDGSGSGNQANGLNFGSNSLPSSPDNAGTGGISSGNTVGDSSQPKVSTAGNNSSDSGSVGDSVSNNTNVGSNNVNTSSTPGNGVYSSNGVRLDR